MSASHQNAQVDLIVVSTNPASDDSGSTDVGGMSFKNDQFIAPLVGFFMSAVTLMFLTFTNILASSGPLAQVGAASLWLVATLVYMAFLVIGRPPRYQVDFFDQIRKGGDLETRGSHPFQGVLDRRRDTNRRHPLRAIERRRLARQCREAGVPPQEIGSAVEAMLTF